MRRALLILATFGIVCLAANQVQAHEYHHGYGLYHHGPVIVRAPLVVGPTVVVPAPVYPQVVYPPMYRYPYYPRPAYGFYYQGRGLSLGVGF